MKKKKSSQPRGLGVFLAKKLPKSELIDRGHGRFTINYRGSKGAEAVISTCVAEYYDSLDVALEEKAALQWEFELGGQRFWVCLTNIPRSWSCDQLIGSVLPL